MPTCSAHLPGPAMSHERTRPARTHSRNYLCTSNQPTIPSQTSAVVLPSSACTMRPLLGQNPSRPPCPFRASPFLSVAPLPRALNFLSLARLSLAAHSAALLGMSVTWGPCPAKARPTLRFSSALTLCPERTQPNMSSRYLRHIRHPFRRTAFFLHTRSPFHHLPTLFELLLSGHFDWCAPTPHCPLPFHIGFSSHDLADRNIQLSCQTYASRFAASMTVNSRMTRPREGHVLKQAGNASTHW